MCKHYPDSSALFSCSHSKADNGSCHHRTDSNSTNVTFVRVEITKGVPMESEGKTFGRISVSFAMLVFSCLITENFTETFGRACRFEVTKRQQIKADIQTVKQDRLFILYPMIFEG